MKAHHNILESLYIKKHGDNSIPCSFSSGENPEKGKLLVVINPIELFQKLSWYKKIWVILRGHEISQSNYQKLALMYFIDEVFGSEDDFGFQLYLLNEQVQSKPWNLSSLTTEEEEKANALEALSLSTRNVFNQVIAFPELNLKIASKSIPYALLSIPMAEYSLIHSMRYYLDVNAHYTFGKIKSSIHPNKDELVVYLYELLSLQQKTALAMLAFHRLCSASLSERKIGNPYLLDDDISAVLKADLIVSYLKATIEKTIALIGLVHEIPKLDELKRHSQKVNKLKEKLSDRVKGTPYGGILMNYITSESLEELNNYRNGTLHKKGYSKTQPHNLVGKEFKELPFLELLNLFTHHHEMNTVVLLGSLAMISDDIMKKCMDTGEDVEGLRQSIFEKISHVMKGVDDIKSDYQKAKSKFGQP